MHAADSEASAKVAGLVLAAGASTRMGRNKMLLPIDGEPLAVRAAGRALAAGLEPVIVVTGHESDKVEELLRETPCRPVLNSDHEKGIQTSVRVGVDALEDDVGALIVILADMPLVTAEMLRSLVRRYRDASAPLVVSLYGTVNAPPVLYDHSLFGELRTMDKGCGKEVVRRHEGKAEMVEWPEEALRDIDVPQDYKLVGRSSPRR